MLQAFLKFLGGEPGEEKHMWLLLGKGFFMGIFLATYQVGSESLFIQELGEEHLDIAFFTTGFLGILSTIIFVNLQARMNFSSLVVTNIFLIFLFIAGTRTAFEFVTYAGTDQFHYLPFILFVMMGPITAITLLGFWGVFGRMFDTRQAKRIIGGIDTGQLIATIIAFFSIPLITRLPFIDQTYDLLFVAGVASFGILFFTIWIIRSFNIDRATKVKRGQKKEQVKFKTIFKDPYTRLLSLFLIFSMGAAIFVNYTFYSATETMFPDEQELNDFLSFFSGTVILMSFMIQSFINDIIIGRFGLRVSLMVMPIILILFTIGTIFSGHIYGYEVKTEQFILFFVFTATAKAFTASLKDALESPAFKLFFLPFDIKIRFDIQTRIEGVVNEFATLAAGAIQIGLGALVFFELIHFAYFVVALAGVVIYLAGKLYNQYKITLQKTLERQREELKDEGKRNEKNTVNIPKSEINTKDETRIHHALRVFEKIDPIEFEFALLDLLNSKFPSVRIYAYQKLREYDCFTSLNLIRSDVKTEGDDSAMKEAKKTIDELMKCENFDLNDESIRQLVRSTDAKDRIKAARILVKSTEDRHLPFLLELLRDINPEVRMAAMVTAGKIKRSELYPILVENLHLATYANAAMSSLIHIGELAFHNIDTSFYKTGQYPSTMVRIVQILGRVKSRQSWELLWKKIDFPNKKIVTELLLSLSYLGFKAKDFQAARIKIIIESRIEDVAWNIKALQDIPHESALDQMIREALLEENKVNYDNIFMLMGMIYDPQNVLLVKENIEAQTTDSIMFAMEMMDVFVEEELKPKLFPIMDDLKDSERLERLLNYFPPEEFESYEGLLNAIVNRNYNSITRYTKSLALRRLTMFEENEVTYDLIADLFNPDPCILQTAAHAIYRINKNEYLLNSKRIKPSLKKELDKAILPPVFIEEGETYHKKILLLDRVLLLKNMAQFASIPGDQITYLAEVMDEIMVKEGTKLIEKGESGTAPIYIVIDGEVNITNEQGQQKVSRGEMFGEKLLLHGERFDFNAVAKGTTTLLVLRKEELADLMSRHIDIMEAYISILNEDYLKEEEEEEVYAMGVI